MLAVLLTVPELVKSPSLVIVLPIWLFKPEDDASKISPVLRRSPPAIFPKKPSVPISIVPLLSNVP